MAKLYDHLDDKLIGFISKQKMFFVATAPLSGEGHVNLSPKGYDAFRVFGPKCVGYADFGGSGIETVAHIRQNGRITLMFCAFEGPAMILRLHGRGRVVQFDDPNFAEELKKFPGCGDHIRNLVFVDVERIGDSCGWGVPFYDFKGERDQLRRYVDNHDLDVWRDSRIKKNAQSIDGLPGLVPAQAAE
jgi:hypothetical protein